MTPETVKNIHDFVTIKLSPVGILHPKQTLLDIMEERLQGTCTWILREPDYQQWRSRPVASPFLCVRSKAGGGKTFVSSQAIQALLDDNHNTDWRVGWPERAVNGSVAYFFCNNRDNDVRTSQPQAILASLISQLLTLNSSCVGLLESVMNHFGSSDDLDDSQRIPTVRELWDMIFKITSIIGKTW